LRHGTPAWVRNGVFFITINCQKRGSNQLCEAPIASVIREAAAFYHAKRWWVHLWLIMPDHLHALLSFPESESIIGVAGDWKRYVARETGVAWQKGFFDHRLRGDESFEEKARYIRMNPVRAGLVNTKEEWSFVFTAQDLDGRDGSPSRPNAGHDMAGSLTRPNDGRLGEASLPKDNQP
jgi:REP element-mobilizing transposase RayT